MGNVTSELVVKLVDQISGPAKTAAGSLDAIDKSAQKLTKAKKFGLPGDIIREMERLKSSTRDVDQVGKSWERMQRIMREKPVGAANYFRTIEDWSRRTVTQLRNLAREQEKVHSGFGKGAAGLAAGVAGAYGVRRVVGAAVKSGASNARENTRDYLGGLSASESAALVAGARTMSGNYKSLDYSTAHERLRDTAMSMGDVNKAIGLQDTLGAGHTVLQSLKGPTAALEESRKFFKALDTLGRNVDGGEIRKLYDGYIKAMGVEGADMNMGDLFKVAIMSKSGGASLSNRFLMSAAPALMQDMKPDRLGTALGSMVSQVIGGRATKESKRQQTKFGLRDKKGKFLDGDMMLADPMEYAEKRLIPALKAKGVNVEDSKAVTTATSALFSSQTVQDLFNKIITQFPQYQRRAQQYDKAPGLAAANKIGSGDPFVALDGLMAQLRNLGASLTEKIMPAAASGMDKLATLVNGFAESAKSSGSALMQVAGALGGIVTGAALASTALKQFLPGIFGNTPAAVAGPAATVGGVLAGGAAASVFSAEVIKNNKEAFGDLTTNPMLGAFGGDASIAAAIQNAPAIAAEIAAREAAAKADAAKRIEDKKVNFGDMAKPAEASAAGAQSGSGFRDALRQELHGAEEDVGASVGRMLNLLNFNASPTVTPKVNTPAGGPGKQSARDTSTKLGSLIDDHTRGSFHDHEFG
jgi:hypothetical protein